LIQPISLFLSFSDISVAAGVALASLKEAMGTEQPVSTSKWKYFDNTILTQPFESATPRLGISCKLQSHINLSRDGSSPPPAWTIRRTGAARKGVRNIFHGAGDERVGVMFSHMTGIDAAENDAAWLVSGNYRWRTDPNNVEGDDFTAEYIKAGGNQKGRSTIAFNVANATIARRKGVNPAAQLSLTSPKITVDTASDAGSAFSLQMISKLQFYPDTVGVPVKLMVPNEVESLLLTGHRNGKVKVWNIADHPLSTVAKYSVSTTPQSASSGIFAGGFLRDSRNIYACDGTIRVWDTETRELLVEIPSEMGFSTCSALPASCGVTASIGSVGDNVLVACSCTSVYYFDLRVRNHGAYSAVAEWKLPIPLQNLSVVAESNVPGVVDRRRAAVASSGSTENNNSSVPLLPLLTCCVTSNDVLYAGANNGFITAVDRRTTKPLITWQAHATGVVKVMSF
jgi:WD40 repeat protein